MRPNRPYRKLSLVIASLALAACTGRDEPAATSSVAPEANSPEVAEVANDDIGGKVTGPNGPEAGVWVIAETRDLGTRFAKIVVTDDAGNYLIPDLPSANYDVWVRGYGLVDSPKVAARPGVTLELAASVAPDAAAAAEYYPAGYWFSMLQVPPASEFPGTGPAGNGINPNVKHQADYIRQITSGGCVVCHQLGNKATREIPALFNGFDSSAAAWARRIQSGQAGGFMTRTLTGMGLEGTTKMFGEWTDRIAAGELPKETPPRPQGVERNVVITQWDWADPTAYLHDLVSTDRRNPTVNAYGKLYGALEESHDYLPVLDPQRHTIDRVPLTMMDPDAEPVPGPQVAESPYYGTDNIWDSRANVHNPMLDAEGRVWITARVRGRDNPSWCRAGSTHPSAQAYPLDASGRQLGVYLPDTGEYKHIDTCFGTHHLMFAEDANDTLWTSGGGQVIGWLNTKQYLETGDYQASQGWTPFILDTNGNGVRDDYVGPDDATDPAKDTQILPGFGFYAVNPAPDGSVWGSILGFPGGVARLVPGDDPARTAITEYYEPPVDETGNPLEGFSPRGMDIDRDGVAWLAMASGHMASFDRRKCTGALNGPEATGQHCPEGWTFYTEPLPQFSGVERSGSSEGSYFTWVDQFDTLGLGANTPINTGNQSGALLALNDGEFVRLTVPYPLGFYTKWLDGRIDDPDAGWKGRGLWATYSSRAPFHMEHGKGATSIVYHFQLRGSPTED
ncbi:MAG TPA: carboxypeptidase-like regulatory domain-containing protein [Pseudomonadales bacterium]